MRVILMHNPKAGRTEHEAEELVRLLTQAGHEVIYQSTKENDHLPEEQVDAVIAAGGDGTVTKVARQLIGRGIPLSVLPLGTANNLARTLGFTGPATKLIAQLAEARKRSFDVGLARGPWGERYFFEGAGGGLFADYLREVAPAVKALNKADPPPSKRQELARHIRTLQRVHRSYEARQWQLKLDDEDISGRYVLVEAMNVRSVGPVLTLAPGARSDDGMFDFVAVAESKRAVLSDYLNARLTRTRSAFPVRSRCFCRLEIRWEGAALHFDDKLWPCQDDRPPRSAQIDIAVQPAALRILLPPDSP